MIRRMVTRHLSDLIWFTVGYVLAPRIDRMIDHSLDAASQAMNHWVKKLKDGNNTSVPNADTVSSPIP